ncbi:MAG: GNAT family N-acetyltransferase, partial [Candidatus Altiarchaeota archaeon]|nr:GNAT family N-acetyltransferase [Candidatus Altiarchaeota archaeon]
GSVVGCAALHQIDEGIAEIRCIVVKNEFKGSGAGKILLDACMREARDNGFSRIFAITLEGDFFMKNGFTRMSKLKIPLKTFCGEPELNPIKFAKWMKLFLKMLLSDSAYGMSLQSM